MDVVINGEYAAVRVLEMEHAVEMAVQIRPPMHQALEACKYEILVSLLAFNVLALQTIMRKKKYGQALRVDFGRLDSCRGRQ